MSDDRLFDSFHMLDGPVQPDEAFAERLFGALAADLGFRPVTRREAIVRRFADAAPTFRLAYLAAMLGLLLAVAIVASLVGAQFLQPRTVADIVAASQAAQLNPPAYDMTIEADEGWSVRVRMDGNGSWRWDWINNRELPPGTYEIHAAGQTARYDPGWNTWIVSPDARTFVDASLLMWQVASQPKAVDPEAAERSPGTAQPPTWFTCPSWTRLADDVVAGRSAYHLACDAREFWVDEESSLLVGMRTPTGQELAGVSGRATALAIEPSFPPDTFALTAPAGAVAIDPNDPPASTVLAIGQSAPRLTGTTLDGTAVDTSTQAGPLVVYFWATWCDPCSGPHLIDLQTVAERKASAVSTLTIATSDQLGTVTGYVAANDIRLPVVYDSTSLANAWGLTAIPVLVMLDPDGVVVALRAGPVSASDLEKMYTALGTGEPVPTPVATPVPSVDAPPTQEPGAFDSISGLAVGDSVPHWSGPLLSGATLDSSTLEGKPTVIWFGFGGCADCPTADLEAFDRAHSQGGTEANFVVVAGGEPTPGWTAALFQRLGIAVPLVFDWDQRIASTFRLNILGTMVLDASGRVSYVAPTALSADELLEVVEMVQGESAPGSPDD